MEPEYRIVFRGEIREGLSPLKVRAHAATRLNVSESQIARMFSGRRVVLKNAISHAAGVAYMERLAKLGMIVSLEPMPETPSPAPSAPQAAPQTSTIPQTASSAPAAVKPVRNIPPEEASWFSNTSFANLARTHLNLARAEALLNNSEYTGTNTITGTTPPAADLPWPKLETDEEAEEAQEEAPPPPPEPEAEAPPEPVPAPATPEPAPPAVVDIMLDAPAASPATLTLGGSFYCPNCGTLHQVQTLVQAAPAVIMPEQSGTT